MAPLFVIRTRDWALPECVGSLITKFHFTQTCLRVDRCNLQCCNASWPATDCSSSLPQTKQLRNERTPCSRVLLQNPAVPQLDDKSPHFIETECSSPCSQQPATCPCPCTPYYPISLKSIVILSSLLCPGHPSGLFPSDFPTKRLHVFFFSPHTCHMFRPSHDPCTNNEAIYCSMCQSSCCFVPLTSCSHSWCTSKMRQ